MALVKKSQITGEKLSLAAPRPPSPGLAKPVGARRRKPSHELSVDSVSERVAAATEELAAGLAEASSAAAELGGSMVQIASGAEEAAGASQAQLVAMREIFGTLRATRSEAEASRRRTEATQARLADAAAQITTSARAIERNARRQEASVGTISELERRARDIGEVTQAVSRISDQTNLLALNAAIEAARAGDHGRGFAVVADEVRALAETSDRNAQSVKSLADDIQNDVRGVASSVKHTAKTSVGEAQAAASVVEALEARRADMHRIAEGSEDVLSAALEAERAASEAQKGAEQVASAAEQQSAAADEARSAVQQQAKSLDQGQVAAQNLAKLAAQLRDGSAN